MFTLWVQLCFHYAVISHTPSLVFSFHFSGCIMRSGIVHTEFYLTMMYNENQENYLLDNHPLITPPLIILMGKLPLTCLIKDQPDNTTPTPELFSWMHFSFGYGPFYFIYFFIFLTSQSPSFSSLRSGSISSFKSKLKAIFNSLVHHRSNISVTYYVIGKCFNIFNNRVLKLPSNW